MKTSAPPTIDLERRAEERCVHVAVTDPGNHRELDHHHDDGENGRGPEIRDQIGQCMAEAPDRGHQAGDAAANPGRAAAGQRAIVGQSLGERHRDAGADRGRKPDQEGLPGVMGGEGGRKQRRQGRDRTVHQPGQPRLHVLQHEHAPLGLVLLGARVGGQDRLAEFLRQRFVLGLDLSQFEEQLSNRDVAGGFRGPAVEAFGFVFHPSGELPHLVEAERTHQPERLAVMDEAADVLAADQRQVLAEFFAVHVEQHAPMPHLLVGHLVEHLGGGGEWLAQTLGETAVDAAVLVLAGDGERENFLLGKFGKTLHICLIMIGARVGRLERSD